MVKQAWLVPYSSVGSSPLWAKQLSEEARRGEGTKATPEGLTLSVRSLEMLCLRRCPLLSACRSLCTEGPLLVALQQRFNQNHSFIQSMNEAPHPVRSVCMRVCCFCSILVACWHHQMQTHFLFFDVKGIWLKGILWPVTSSVLSPDQRVASFCTMTDMQRAEALQISRELTRRVVEAEGAALEAE